MDTLCEYAEKIVNNKIVVIVWAVVIVVLLFIIIGKEGFLGEFKQAPIAIQRPPELLGTGSYNRFSSEMSSTNQGGDNVIASMMGGKEHLVGAMEPPVIQSSTIPTGLANWQDNTSAGFKAGDEAFTARSNYIEPFMNHDDKLKQIIRGF